MAFEETLRLVRKVVDGGGADLPALLERIRPRVVLWATSHLTASLRAREDPEDLAQRILCKIHERMVAFEGRDERAFFQWVWQIGRNEIIDLHRYYEAHKRGEGVRGSESAMGRVAADASTPLSRVARREMADLVKRIVEDLPQEMRDVFRFCKLEGLAADAAGAEMGRTANAVRILLCRTLQRIRDALRARGISVGAA